MADSGAWENFISPELVAFLGAPRYRNKDNIRAKIADGTVMESMDNVVVDMEAFGIRFRMRFHILEPWGPEPPIVIGWPGWKEIDLIANRMKDVPRLLSARNLVDMVNYVNDLNFYMESRSGVKPWNLEGDRVVCVKDSQVVEKGDSSATQGSSYPTIAGGNKERSTVGGIDTCFRQSSVRPEDSDFF